MRKTVLGLNLPTDPRWTNIANKKLENILTDHAYCEQKAASSCISLIIQYPDKEKIVEMLTPVVAEEWNHFQQVIEQLKKRGFKLGAQRRDEYVLELNKHVKKGGSREQQLVEKLLINALIEARSCERFKLLSNTLKDQELKNFYHELMVSEAGHYSTFLELAKMYCPEKQVEERWKELLRIEAQIMDKMEVRGDRIH